MKKYLASVFLVFSQTCLWAQKPNPVSLLDTMPDIKLNFSFNNSSGIKNLSDLKGKIVLLDFWNVTCTSCIEAFPKLEALQKQFAADFFIISLTRDSRKKVEALFNKNSDNKTSLPVIANDTIFEKYFTVRQPHHAWLDRNGRVLAIGHSYNTTEKNIQRAILGQSLNIPLLTQVRNFNTTIPLALNPSIKASGLFRQYNMLSGFQNGILMDGGAVKDSNSTKIVWRSFYNKSILSLLKFAFGNFKGIDNPYGSIYDTDRIELLVKNPQRFISPTDVEQRDLWRFDNFYCYEIGVVPKNAHLMAEYMQADLQRYFGIKVVPTTRKKKVFVLQLSSAENSQKNTQGFGLLEEDKKEYRLRNYNSKELVQFLNKLKLSPKPIIALEASDFQLDLNLAKKNLTKERFINYIRSFGIKLVETDQEEGFLFIEDIP